MTVIIYLFDIACYEMVYYDFTTLILPNPQPIKPFQKSQSVLKCLCQPIVSSCQVPAVFLLPAYLLALPYSALSTLFHICQIALSALCSVTSTLNVSVMPKSHSCLSSQAIASALIVFICLFI